MTGFLDEGRSPWRCCVCGKVQHECWGAVSGVCETLERRERRLEWWVELARNVGVGLLIALAVTLAVALCR